MGKTVLTFANRVRFLLRAEKMELDKINNMNL